MMADTTNIGNIINTCEVRWSDKTIQSVTVDASWEIYLLDQIASI